MAGSTALKSREHFGENWQCIISPEFGSSYAFCLRFMDLPVEPRAMSKAFSIRAIFGILAATLGTENLDHKN
jgi:hypothetical protein